MKNSHVDILGRISKLVSRHVALKLELSSEGRIGRMLAARQQWTIRQGALERIILQHASNFDKN
eukprot:11027-Amphidinium_carterae.2